MEVTRTEGEGPEMRSVNQGNNLVIGKPHLFIHAQNTGNVISDWLDTDKIQYILFFFTKHNYQYDANLKFNFSSCGECLNIKYNGSYYKT